MKNSIKNGVNAILTRRNKKINNEEEIWKALPGVMGVEVSTLGRVRTLDRVTSSEHRTRFLKGRVLKQNDNGRGYLCVHIPIDRKHVSKNVHQLVAKTFIANPNNLPQVNHKDCDRTNNHVNNLEWCDNSYNIQYREKYGEALGQPVFTINLKTLEISRFRSRREAGRKLGIYHSNINSVIKGEIKQTNGYWFVNDDNNTADAIKQKLHEIKYQTVK